MSDAPDPQEEREFEAMLNAACPPGVEVDHHALRQIRERTTGAFLNAARPGVTPPPARRMRHLLPWLAPLAAAAAVALVLLATWSDRGPGVAWADVVKQVQIARTAHLTVWTYEDDMPALNMSGDVYYRAPDAVRFQKFPTADDPTPPPDLEVGRRRLNTDERTHLYIVEEDVEPRLINSVRVMLGVFSMPNHAVGDQKAVGTITIDDQPPVEMHLIDQGMEKIDGETLKRFEVVRRMPDGKTAPFMEDQQRWVWCDENNQVRHARIIWPQAKRRLELKVRLDVPLADSLFEFSAPPGYTDVREGIFPRLSPELREIADAYYAARESFQHYRMVVANYAGGKMMFPRYRQVRDGDRWRLDSLDILYTAQPKNRRRFMIAREPLPDFEDVWRIVDVPGVPLDKVIMTYRDQLAMITFAGPPQPQSQWLVPPMSIEISAAAAREVASRRYQRWFNQAPRSMAGRIADYDLRELGWPRWIGDEWIAHHGWDMGSAMPEYYRLADRADRPGLIGVRCVTNQSHVHDYWIDPARDYLCVDYRDYFDPDKPWQDDPAAWDPDAYYKNPRPTQPGPEPRQDGRTIKQFARTAEGNWFPRALKNLVVFLDTQGEIAPAWFDWPAGAPKPDDVAEDHREIIQKAVTVGTPAAEEQKLRMLCDRRIHNLAQGCVRYRRDHDRWPESLDVLVELNYVEAEDLINPRQPDRKPGFIYRQPPIQKHLTWEQMRAIIWEAHDPQTAWTQESLHPSLPSGIFVANGFGIATFVDSQQEFEKQLAHKHNPGKK